MLISADFSGGRQNIYIVLELYFKTALQYLTTLSGWEQHIIGPSKWEDPLVGDQSCSV